MVSRYMQGVQREDGEGLSETQNRSFVVGDGRRGRKLRKTPPHLVRYTLCLFASLQYVDTKGLPTKLELSLIKEPWSSLFHSWEWPAPF